MSEHGPACPECGSCCADDCIACPSCGHCHELHGSIGQYCRWRSEGGLYCSCLLTQTQAMQGVDRWPDEEDEEEATT